MITLSRGMIVWRMVYSLIISTCYRFHICGGLDLTSADSTSFLGHPMSFRTSPGNSRWLLYNLSSGSLQDVGHSKTYGFFLDHDVLGDGSQIGPNGSASGRR